MEDYNSVPKEMRGNKTLLIDGDLLLYKICFAMNDNTDDSTRMLIAKTIDNTIEKYLEASNCVDYITFLSNSSNFRKAIAEDYKLNRKDAKKPLNLTWAKGYVVVNHNGKTFTGLECDDLLAMCQTDKTVIHSEDKDLKQVEGWHLDHNTMQLIFINSIGGLYEKNNKITFTGLAGFYFQLLTGDTSDNILGCADRVLRNYASGNKLTRKGIGPKAALKIINNAVFGNNTRQLNKVMKEVVIKQYKEMFGDNWKSKIEQQGRLLWMVREGYIVNNRPYIRLWTIDGRLEYMSLEDSIKETPEISIIDEVPKESNRIYPSD